MRGKFRKSAADLKERPTLAYSWYWQYSVYVSLAGVRVSTFIVKELLFKILITTSTLLLRYPTLLRYTFKEINLCNKFFYIVH